ncbi:MAG: hypothetical protein ABFD84_05115, partial [Candidatus Polarisedimenticolia bacterium]
TAVRSHVLAYLQGGVCGLGPGDVMPVPGTIGIKNAWVQRESVRDVASACGSVHLDRAVEAVAP